jgi:hypothetical protein
MRKQSYEWAAKSAIEGGVNAIQNFARMCNQKSFGSCDALWRLDRDTIRMSEGEVGYGLIADNFMLVDMSGMRPVHGRHGHGRQVFEDVLGRDPVPGYPNELVIKVCLHLPPTGGISRHKVVKVNDCGSASRVGELVQEVLQEGLIQSHGTNQKNVSCSSAVRRKDDSLQQRNSGHWVHQ